MNRRNLFAILAGAAISPLVARFQNPKRIAEPVDPGFQRLAQSDLIIVKSLEPVYFSVTLGEALVFDVSASGMRRVDV